MFLLGATETGDAGVGILHGRKQLLPYAAAYRGIGRIYSRMIFRFPRFN